MYISLINMQNNKSPGNDEQTKEFLVVFLERYKIFFKRNSCCTAKLKKELNTWIETLILKQESCTVNGGDTKRGATERGASKEVILKEGLAKVTLFRPICSPLIKRYYLYLVRNNKDIKGLNIFDHLCLYTAYADDTTFFY